jgi:DNA invertase Pin-like site-specific DNA recombinase
MKKAIAYIRFSSEGQADGTSIERQTEFIQTYCAAQKLTLVETLIDEGLSAYKGEHLSENGKGKLGTFLKDALAGKYRDHALVVEQMDRLSRQGIKATRKLLDQLLESGVEVHITQTNRVIKDGEDIVTEIMNTLENYGAKEYAKKLSERLTKAWRIKKDNATAGVAITSRIPFWLEATTGSAIVEMPERVATVKKIFALAESGYGAKRIANQLIQDGDQPFTKPGCKKQGRSWTLVYIQAILANRAVLGEYQPKKYLGKSQRVADGEAIENFFPQIISQTQFDAVRAGVKSRNRISDDKRQHCGGRGDGSRNLFSHLIFDASTGKAMNLHIGGKNHSPVLVSAWVDKVKANRIDYGLVERGMLNFLGDLDWKAVANDADPKGVVGLKIQLDEVATEIDRLTRVIARDSKLVEDPDTDDATYKFVQKGLAEKDARLGQLTEAREKMTAEINSERNKLGIIQDPAALIALIRSDKSTDIRIRLHRELRKRVKRIDLTFNDSWVNERGETEKSVFKCVADVQFINNVIRGLAFTDKQTLVIKAEGSI